MDESPDTNIFDRFLDTALEKLRAVAAQKRQAAQQKYLDELATQHEARMRRLTITLRENHRCPIVQRAAATRTRIAAEVDAELGIAA